MIGLYFSGTGNSKHCLERFVTALDETAQCYAIESENATEAILNSDRIVIAYPIYYSALPKILHDFIVSNASLFQGKKVFAIATFGMFSGDGAGCAARLLKKYGATVVGGLHLKMPDCIGDVKLLKKTELQNNEIIRLADEKIDCAVKKIKNGKYPQQGLGFLSRMAGLFVQRLYFGAKTKRYYKKIKIDPKKCVGCGTCVPLCPMQNIAFNNKTVQFLDRCTMCYRCFSNCPQKAITVLGKKVYAQYLFPAAYERENFS